MQMTNRTNLKNLELLAVGEMFAEHGGTRLALEISRQGGDTRQFMKEITERIRNGATNGTADQLLGFSNLGDSAGYSISSAITAAANRDWSRAGLEKAVSDLGTTKTGVVPNGFYSPIGLLTRDFNAGSANQAGNMIGAEIAGARSADPLRKVSALARMGATFIPGLRFTLELPRFDSSSAISAKGEVAAADAVLETTTLAVLAPKRYSVKMILSRQALLQATPALDASIGRHLTQGLMSQLEYDALNGDGTADTPVGLRSTAGVGNVAGGTNGAQIAWSHLVAMENLPDAANAGETDFSGFIVNAATRKWLRTTVRGTGLPFIWADTDRPLLGRRAAVSNILPSNLVKGASGSVCSSLCYSSDWSQLVVGIYGPGVDVLVDPVTMADTGRVIVNASLLAGVGANLPAAFSKMDDGLTV